MDDDDDDDDDDDGLVLLVSFLLMECWKLDYLLFGKNKTNFSATSSVNSCGLLKVIGQLPTLGKKGFKAALQREMGNWWLTG